MTLGFFKWQCCRKVIGLPAFHRGFDNCNTSSINYLWSGNVAGDAHKHSPTRMHANTKGCGFHSVKQTMPLCQSKAEKACPPLSFLIFVYLLSQK